MRPLRIVLLLIALVTAASAQSTSPPSEPVNSQTGTTYTVKSSDRSKLVTHSNASPVAVTLPRAISPFGHGWFYDTSNRGAGTVTITPTTSTIDGAASLALTTNQGVRIISNGVNYFTVRGMGAAGGGTVTSVSVTTANGVSGTVATPTTTPAITLTLGAITPTTVAVGTTPATAGIVRVPNDQFFFGRDFANAANISLFGVNVDNEVSIDPGGVGVRFGGVSIHPTVDINGGVIESTTVGPTNTVTADKVEVAADLTGLDADGELVLRSTDGTLHGFGASEIFQVWTSKEIAPGANLAALVNPQTGTTYTYLTGDRGKLVTHTNGSAIAGTLPQANSTTFKNGWFVDLQNRGVGTLTVTPTTSTIDGAASLALTTSQGVRIFSDGTNYFTQRGAGAGGSGTTINTTDTTVPYRSSSTTFADSPLSVSSGRLISTPSTASSGVSPFMRFITPADTGQTADTEFTGMFFGGDASGATVIRTGADGTTIPLQRENRFIGPTYAFAGATTITDVFTTTVTPPVPGTNATFTRNHSFGIVDSTSATSSITGGLIVAATVGTTATSVGIGGGNINAGGTINSGGTITAGGTGSVIASATGRHGFTGRTRIESPVNSQLLLQNDASSGFQGLSLGPTMPATIGTAPVNGQGVAYVLGSELLTIAAAATSTTTTLLVPAGAVIESISVRVTVAIPTATTFTVKLGATTCNFAAGVSTAVNTMDVGTGGGNFTNPTDQQIVITPNSTPADTTGRVRVTVTFKVTTPPSS